MPAPPGPTSGYAAQEQHQHQYQQPGGIGAWGGDEAQPDDLMDQGTSDRLRAVRELPEAFHPLFSFRCAAWAACKLHAGCMNT